MGYKLKDYLLERGLTMEKFKQLDPLTQETVRKEHKRLVEEANASRYMSEEEYYLGDIVPFGPDGPLGIG